LAVPARENGTFFGNQVDVWSWMTERRTAVRVRAKIVPAGVVGHQHDDVRSLLLRRCLRGHRRHGGDARKQPEP
jgi:hypothetical protein